MSVWKLKRNKADTVKMASVLNIKEPVACILANRGIGTYKAAMKFLLSPRDGLYDFELFKDSEKAIDIIKKAVTNRLKIAVYGDYDVDGVMSTTILYKALKYLGADVIFYLPHRQREGYGMNIEAVRHLHELGVKVILTCDNGIAAIDEIGEAARLGIVSVIIDHHEPKYEKGPNGEKFDIVPLSEAIIDAKQSKCQYPFKFLCAAGMSYKFAEALFKSMNRSFVYDDEFMAFAAIATVCDIVSLLDENRIIVKNGLKLVSKIENKGMKALIKLTGLEGKEINEYHAGFVIGPCVNATGRLESAETAVKLFSTDNEEEAYSLAAELVRLNAERKDMTSKAVEEAIEAVNLTDLKNDKVLVIYNSQIHESIAGIVAGKVKEAFYKPTIIITDSGQLAKGSGRSIEAYNMFDELLKCQELFEKFGGHPMAAGLSLKKENIDILRKMLNNNCCLTVEDMTSVIRIDKQLGFDQIDIELALQLESLSPFGKDCPPPVFGTKDVSLKRLSLMGKDKNMLRFTLSHNYKTFVGVSFSGYEKFCRILNERNILIENILGGYMQDFKMDIVYGLNINRYNGRESVQLDIKDFRF